MCFKIMFLCLISSHWSQLPKIWLKPDRCKIRPVSYQSRRYEETVLFLRYQFTCKLHSFSFNLMPKALLSGEKYCWNGCLKNTVQKDSFDKTPLEDGHFFLWLRIKAIKLKSLLFWNESNCWLNLILKWRWYIRETIKSEI